jgi:hypothetical protein
VYASRESLNIFKDKSKKETEREILGISASTIHAVQPIRKPS